MKSRAKFTKIRILTTILMLTAILGTRADLLAQKAEEALNATASFKAGETVAPDTAIEISLSRALTVNEKISVTIGQTDVTNLFSQTENRFTYNAKVLPLPIGDSNLTVYLIGPTGNWKEIARLPLLVKEAEKGEATQPEASKEKKENATETKAEAKTQEIEKPENKTEKQTEEPAKTEEKKSDSSEVKTADAKSEDPKTDENKTVENKTVEPKTEEKKTEEAKSEETKTEETKTETPTETTKETKSFFKFLPSLTISLESQPFQSNFPISARPAERATFTDFNLTGSIKTEARIGNLTNESNFDFAGSSFKDKTLQFGTLGKEAPDVDLSSYLMNFQIGKAKFSLGHTGFGNNRHLVSSFSSRGLSLNIPINKYFDVTGGVVNGTSVLGFGNFLGMSKIRHQVQGATLGIEFFPKRQNAMRLEVTGFNGYLQAVTGVSEGRVVDAERSRGLGLRFITSDKTERFKLEFGFALSRFVNPQDTTLDPNGTAVALPAAMRAAHYIDASYQLFKDLKLTKTRNLKLNFAFKYEYVEPLYRSLGASASADKFSQDYALDGSLGEITFQAGHARSNDNLRNVPSILQLLTQSNRFSVALPFAALIGNSEKPSPFLPRLGYSIDQTHNFGAAIPVNGGFEADLTTIPNLLNTNQSISSAWQFKKFNFEYKYGRSYADNRQTGAENKDQLGWVHGFTVGVNPLEILSFNVGFSLDSQRNFELNQVNGTKTLNLGTTWQPFKGATFTGEMSQTLAGDAAKTNLTRNVNYSGQFAYSFNLGKSGFRKFGMQAFVRFADAFARNRDFTNDLNNRTRTKIMTAGMTFNFF